MKKENIPRIQEKLKYLLSISFKESQFKVLNINVEIDDYTENENGDIEIFSYDIFPTLNFMGPIEGWSPWQFRNDLGGIFERALSAARTYSIKQDGKLVSGSKDAYIEGPSIITMNYKIEEQHEFLFGFKVIYPDKTHPYH
jgi:hypothetical protein